MELLQPQNHFCKALCETENHWLIENLLNYLIYRTWRISCREPRRPVVQNWAAGRSRRETISKTNEYDQVTDWVSTELWCRMMIRLIKYSWRVDERLWIHHVDSVFMSENEFRLENKIIDWCLIENNMMLHNTTNSEGKTCFTQLWPSVDTTEHWKWLEIGLYKMVLHSHPLWKRGKTQLFWNTVSNSSDWSQYSYFIWHLKCYCYICQHTFYIYCKGTHVIWSPTFHWKIFASLQLL